MHLDVQDLRNFYYRSALGRAAQKSLRGRMLQLWPEAKGQTVAGYGFAVPLLRPYLQDARRVMALMPGPQGVMPWPAGQHNVSALIEETMWPIETGHVDKLVVMHGLETSDRPQDLLEECWRVLGPGGKALFIVPNRAGLWSRRDRTPFGYGRPYSASQLETQLRKHQFLPERHVGALYQFPSGRRLWMKSAAMFEGIGRAMPGMIAGGAFMVEASKLVYPPKGTPSRARKRVSVLEGLTEPVVGRSREPS
ncbi:methyltransferase domain-containing protein [Pseudosulfitobacter pseudonitzschiae]|uniref:ATP synthase n=1 Tax=Pseudosulfitobacter pseudonitzschiae TaxID=1402135 RepID=A0A073J3W2_9RHOB|nr:methyltransferase domain-containing protein [Pseudosulfitobacter pseudonitzschiae]KEJ96654.1 ATP synthase [Pseudosulfitobacter pseudonitzschiae]MBM1814142.1 methyltransferase domain-containing protein [Pseudosulfitobacter pseudonitzschiae]MBM1831135.1 methyltransferase domain-containing protein [Pseudosulfitobacter pseudonitzschiae]MBM1836002.1 methyltransferase domain-containing protein [Pseudosulfitobacter pseudonitzschiae]MBM1840848.1 methyltransferase domain-containing protein [Pseudosu